MFGPGEYRADPSEGITTPAALPPPELIRYHRSDTRHPCPRCGHLAYRDKQYHRTLHDLGNLDLWCPRDLVVTYSQHYCTKCRKYFNFDLSDLAPAGSHYTHRVIDLAVRLVVEDSLPYRPASWHLWRDLFGGVDQVISELGGLVRKMGGKRFKRRRKLLGAELNYFKNQRERMAYADYQARGLPIGSGVVEAACKTLATQRLKR